MGRHGSDPGKRLAQRKLAEDLTVRVHGEAAADQAMKTSQSLFSGGSLSDTLTGVELPERRVSRAALPALSVVELLLASGLATSKADARRGIQGRGFYLNDEAIEAVDRELEEDELRGPPEERYVILRKGKKNYVRLVLEP
jgi:tyrosyl-tRNA synthetase